MPFNISLGLVIFQSGKIIIYICLQEEPRASLQSTTLGHALDSFFGLAKIKLSNFKRLGNNTGANDTRFFRRCTQSLCTFILSCRRIDSD